MTAEPRYCLTKYCVNIAPPERVICYKCKTRKQREKDPIRAVYDDRKSSARRRHIDFNWTFEEFKQFCEKTNYMELRGTGANDMTIDRIRAWEGYHKDNVQLLPNAENVKKRWREPKTDPNVNPWPDTPF